MTNEEIAVLANKVKDGTSTPQEELALLQYLNQGVEEMRTFVKQVMTSEPKTEITQ